MTFSGTLLEIKPDYLLVNSLPLHIEQVPFRIYHSGNLPLLGIGLDYKFLFHIQIIEQNGDFNNKIELISIERNFTAEKLLFSYPTNASKSRIKFYPTFEIRIQEELSILNLDGNLKNFKLKKYLVEEMNGNRFVLQRFVEDEGVKIGETITFMLKKIETKFLNKTESTILSVSVI